MSKYFKRFQKISKDFKILHEGISPKNLKIDKTD